MAHATSSGAALRRLQVSCFPAVSPAGESAPRSFLSSASAPGGGRSAGCVCVSDTYPVPAAAAAVADADVVSSRPSLRHAPRRRRSSFSSPACASTASSRGSRPPAAALSPRLAVAAAVVRPLPAAAAATAFFSSFLPGTAATSSCFSPLSATASSQQQQQQQRGYRHWARHRAFEKIRRLPNRALRPGCCAASLFPTPSISSSSSSRLKAGSSSSRTSSSSDGSSTSHSSSSTHTSTGSSKPRRTVTGAFSPNIMGSMSVHGDYRVARTAGGGFRLVPPYPPRINKTIEPYPPSASKYFTINRSYPLQWRNVEYKYVPARLPRPYASSTSGQAGAAWGGDLIRIFHKRKGWKRKEK